MLKIVGSIYSETNENFEELCRVLEKEGYEIAYSSLSTMSASILKNVAQMENYNNESENQTV